METIPNNGDYLSTLSEVELKKSSECKAELLPNQVVHFHAPPPIPPPPMFLNQFHPPPPPMPVNVVINSNQNDGGNFNNGPTFFGGGFPCPFCRLGVMKRQRNPLIKFGVVIAALILFPLGLLACFLLFTPCAYQNKCTTCKKKV